MRVSSFCFLAAAACGLLGMSLGVYMGIREDFTLAPAHAHLNLLGWVSLALYGLYHRGVERASERLAWAQAGCAAAGAPVMAGGLAALLATGDATLAPLIVAGALLALAGLALFLATVLVDMRRAGLAPALAPALAS